MSRAEDDELLALGRRIAYAHDEIVDRDDVLATARAGLVARRRKSRGPLVLGLMAAAAALATGIVLTRPVGLSIEGKLAGRTGDRVPEGAERNWVTAGDEPAVARFSEGSSVRVEPGSSVRVLSRDALGARLSVEHGAADIDLRPGLLKRWEVEAGPFQISGSDARYRVEWHPDTGEARVRITAGSVFVSNPCGSSRRLGADEEAFFRCQTPAPKQTAEAPAQPVPTVLEAAPRPPSAPPTTSSVRVAEANERAPRRAIVPGPAPSPAPVPRFDTPDVVAAPTLPLPPPVGAPPALTGEPTPVELAPVASAPVPPRAPAAWRDLVLLGDYTGALGKLGPEGIGNVLADGTEDDVSVLADACRFTGQVDGAQRSLTTLRRRFPKSAAARTAAFHLGRLALDKQNSPATAAIWFRKYLEEGSTQALREEALGLLFQAEGRAGDTDASALHAQEYLDKYPDGLYRRAALGAAKKP